MPTADEIIRKLLSGDRPENPAGQALCLITVDLYRITGEPADERLLRLLLAFSLGPDEAGEEVFRDGLAWAAKPVPGTGVTLLRQSRGDDGLPLWEPDPAVNAADAGSDRPVHQAVVWLVAENAKALAGAGDSDTAAGLLRAAAQADPSAAQAAAIAAHDLLQAGQDTVGRAFAEIAVEHGKPELAAPMAGVLADSLQRAGDYETAIQMWRNVIGTGLPQYLPGAWFNLGGCLLAAGRPEEACEYLRWAAESGDPEYAVRASGALGLAALDLRRIDEAIQALQEASRGSDNASLAVSIVLGDVLSERGDLPAAEQAYRKVLDSGHADHAPAAAYGLSTVLLARGDTAGAIGILRPIVESDQAASAPQAAARLASLAADDGDWELAEKAWRAAARSGDPEHAPAAAHNLGLFLEEKGDHAGALLAYAQAAAADSESSSWSALALGQLATRLGDRDSAIGAYQRARAWPHAEAFGPACYNLGCLLWEQGNTEQALTAFQDAARSGNPAVTASAELAAGRLLEGAGQQAAAADAFARALDAVPDDDHPTRADATRYLANLLRAHRTQYPRLLREASENAAAFAAVGLAYALADDDLNAAKQTCELAIASGRSAPARNGAYLLGLLLRAHDDIPDCAEAITCTRTQDPLTEPAEPS